MTDVLIDARRGAGSSLEILYGTVTWKPTLTHSRGTSIVLPAPTTFDLVDGQVVATNVQPTPEPVEGQIEWAYEVTFKDRHSKTYSFLVGVPDSTSQVNFITLPRYFETKPPLFGQGEQGIPGDAATVAVGTVAEGGEASVTNSGTNTDAVLDFVLPKGDKGDTGVGVPEGGTEGQLVRKTLTGTEWVDYADAVPLADATKAGLVPAGDYPRITGYEALENRNLNTVVLPGKYNNIFVANSTTANNYPFEGASAYLEVIPFRGTPGAVAQEITRAPSGEKWYRRSSDNGVTWTDWEKYAQQSDITSAIVNIPLADDDTYGLLPAGKVSKIIETVTAPSGSINGIVAPNDYSQNVISQATTSNGWPWNMYSQVLRVRNLNSSGSRVEQSVLNAVTMEVARRRSTNALDPVPTWSAWKFDVRSSDIETVLKPETYRVSLSNYTDFREDTVNGVPRITRSGNTYFLYGAVRVNSADLISTGNYVEILRLPEEAMPTISTYLLFVTGTTSTHTYNIRIEPDGRVRVGRSSNTAADSLVMFNGISWPGQYRDPANTYYLDLNKFVRNVEFSETYSLGSKPSISILSIHGGETEKITTELGIKINQSLNGSRFDLQSLLDPMRGRSAFDLIHHDSNDYTNVNALAMVTPSTYCVSLHGAADNIYGDTGAMSYVGGLDLVLRQKISDALNAVGFPARHDSENFPGLAGTSTSNICNQTTTGMGVQIELNVTQRRAFVTGGDLSRPNRVNTTPAFNSYAQVIVDTVNTHIASQP